jgi:glycine cleavage system protein P-like pyridoxal-binding family
MPFGGGGPPGLSEIAVSQELDPYSYSGWIGVKKREKQ